MGNKTSSNYQHKKNKIMYETNILKNLRHKNIVQFFESFESENYILIIMEYISCGDLLSYVRRRSRIPETIAKFMFKQIIEGIQYIHSKNVIHRDIKLDNILIDLNNTIKICDFGVSKQIKKGEIINDQCGTPAYIAPEILKGNGYEGYGVDIWSAGVALYTMLTGTVPFKANNIKELQRLIIKGQYLNLEEFNINLDSQNNNLNNLPVSSEAIHLIKCILEVDPKKRITIEGILNHNWIKSLDNKQISKLSLFTEIEKVMLSKSKADLRIGEKNLVQDNFTLKNLDTLHEKANENNNSKSIILAPFNSSIHEEDFDTYGDKSFVLNSEDPFYSSYKISNYKCEKLEINNKLIKYVGKVKGLNNQYELDHNQEMDVGKIISPMQGSFEDEEENGIKSPPNEEAFLPRDVRIKDDRRAKSAFGFQVNKSIDEKVNLVKVNNGNGVYSISGNKSSIMINDEILDEMEKLGYSKNYVSKVLVSNELNYATSCYYLLVNSEG